jgi:hypothetical protein
MYTPMVAVDEETSGQQVRSHAEAFLEGLEEAHPALVPPNEKDVSRIEGLGPFVDDLRADAHLDGPTRL